MLLCAYPPESNISNVPCVGAKFLALHEVGKPIKDAKRETISRGPAVPVHSTKEGVLS